MIICYKTKNKLNSADKKVISRLNEYGIDGYLVRNKDGVLLFHLRKPGMLSYFKVRICSKSAIENGFKELKHLDRALTERVEQEERAKQCGLILGRIRKLGNATETYLSPLKFYWPVNKTDEVKDLIAEYERLVPINTSTYDIGGSYRNIYPWWYWDDYVHDVKVRSAKVEYIPKNYKD